MKFRLLKASEYSLYSEQLKQFEAQFNYPLGEQTFQINHGTADGNYFAFFQSLGNENVFILEHKGRLLGVGCAILRKVTREEAQSFWYLCDFKLDQSVRGKNILTYLLIRYLIPFYCKSKNLVVINMSSPKNNWLVKKINSTLFFLRLKIKPLYFYEWTNDEYEEVLNMIPDAFSDMALYTNYGNKDIIIGNEVRPVIHIVNKDHASINLPSHNTVNIDKALFKEATNQPVFMLASSNKLKNCVINQPEITPSYIGTMILSKAINGENLRFSSLEI